MELLSQPITTGGLLLGAAIWLVFLVIRPTCKEAARRLFKRLTKG
tara:strand:- start:1046 stop:1180 length:135 start_codon:yes stop_codon:yes gene_type:complete